MAYAYIIWIMHIIFDTLSIVQSSDNMELVTRLQAEQHSVDEMTNKLKNQEEGYSDLRDMVRLIT